MTTAKGNSGYVKVGGATVAEVKSYAINSTCTLEDNTGIESEWKEFFVTNTEWAAEVSLFWDDANTALFPLGQEVALTFVPESATEFNTRYVGTGLVISRQVTANFDTMVEASIRVIGVGQLLFQNQFSKVFIDTTLVVDVPVRAFGKNLSETLGLTDDQIFNIGKSLSENPAVAESAALSLAKPFLEALGVTDLASLNLGKVFSENIGVTDDVDGEAGIDDDQNIAFFKNRNNTVGVAELFTRIVAYDRDFSETVSLGDTPAKSVGRPLADSFSVAESIVILLTKIKNLSDTLSAIDTLAFATGKSLADSSAVAELASKNVSKIPADSSNITDDDTIQFLKARADSAAVSDSGDLISQDYVDNNLYFLEDYVGTTRSF